MGETEGSGGSRRALVVGNSDGIGLALTRRLLDDGWRVTGLSRRVAPITHDRYAHTVADVTDEAYPRALAAAIGALGGVDLCVYAAGVGEFLPVDALAGPGSLSGQTRTLDVNLMGAAITLEAVVPGMVHRGGGHVVVLSSLADAVVSDVAPAYSASKAGLTAYCRGLDLALRRHGVSVTAVRFGFVDTKMAKAPMTPFKLTVERAVDVVLDAVRRRPAVVSRPRRMAAVVRLLAVAAILRPRPRREAGDGVQAR